MIRVANLLAFVAGLLLARAWAQDSTGSAGVVPGRQGPTDSGSAAPATNDSRERPALFLAQVCWLESTWRHDDCAAVVYVLRTRAKRAGVSVVQMAHAYSAIDRKGTRAAFARALPAELTPRELQRWHALVEVARGALAGTVQNPCRGATHWGARDLPRDLKRATDAVQAGRWRVVQCATTTANAFYSEVAR